MNSFRGWTTPCIMVNHFSEWKVPLSVLTARSCIASCLIKHVSLNMFAVSLLAKEVGLFKPEGEAGPGPDSHGSGSSAGSWVLQSPLGLGALIILLFANICALDPKQNSLLNAWCVMLCVYYVGIVCFSALESSLPLGWRNYYLTAHINTCSSLKISKQGKGNRASSRTEEAKLLFNI